MTLVELAGIEAGVIDPQRDDPRLFTQGRPDPFTTIRERELVQTVDVTEMNTNLHTRHARNGSTRLSDNVPQSSPPESVCP